MTPSQYTRIVLQQRPKGDIDANTFRRETVPFDLKPGPKQVLVKVNWLAFDAAMRGWLRDVRSYIKPVGIGEVMRADGLVTVVQSGEGSRYKVGDLLSCAPGNAYMLWPCIYADAHGTQAGPSMLFSMTSSAPRRRYLQAPSSSTTSDP